MKKNILITGVSGSGKTTVAEALRSAGHRAVDMDEEFCTMYYKDSALPVDTDFQNHDLTWVQSVEWKCDISKVQKLLAQPGTIFCCGSADNIEEILPLFDAVVLLQINEEAFRHRLTHRTNNDWGKEEDVQDWLLEQKKEYEQKVLKHEPVCMDAHRSIEAIVAKVLAIVD